MRLEMDAMMRRSPGDAGFSATADQVSVLGRPARLFLMRARMFGLPVRALRLHRGDEATFQVRAAGLRLPRIGHAVYDRPDGPFTDAEFALRWIAHDEAG